MHAILSAIRANESTETNHTSEIKNENETASFSINKPR